MVRYCESCGLELGEEVSPDPFAQTMPADPEILAEARRKMVSGAQWSTRGRTRPMAQVPDQRPPPKDVGPAESKPELVDAPRSSGRWAAAMGFDPGPGSIAERASEVQRAAVAPYLPAMGTRVFVQWSDGRFYAGIVERHERGQCCVRFQDGLERWIDPRCVRIAG